MLKKLSSKEFQKHKKNISILGYTKIDSFITPKYRKVFLKKIKDEHKKKLI